MDKIVQKNNKVKTFSISATLTVLFVVGSVLLPLLPLVGENQAYAIPTSLTIITGLGDAVDVAYDPIHERMYVTGGSTGDIYVIDTNTNSQVAGTPIKITGGSFLDRIAYDPEHETMYISDRASNNVNVIDTNTNAQVEGSPIDIGSSSQGIAYDPVNQKMYVASSGPPPTVTIIDTDTNAVDGTVPLLTGGEPRGIAYDPEHQRMYVTQLGSPGTVKIIDTTTNTVDTMNGPVTVGDDPNFGIAYDPIHQMMYVPNLISNDVSVIDTNASPNVVTSTISGIPRAAGIEYDPVNERMYVTQATVTFTAGVRAIDTNTDPPSFKGGPIPVGDFPLGIAYDPVHGSMYVANEGSNSVQVIQITSVSTTITSAIDGNGNPVANEGTATSDDITFAFSATADPFTTVAGFECSLDGAAFSSCTSPKTYNNLALGQHFFEVRGVDELGNREVPPIRFTWTIEEIDPATAIRDLTVDARTLSGVNFGVKATLMTQLRLALNIVSDNNPSNDFSSCALMNAFTTSVNTFRSQGLLTAAQAADLLQQAQEIKNAIGCTASSTASATTTTTTPTSLASSDLNPITSLLPMPLPT